jgi:hypothetical protein
MYLLYYGYFYYAIAAGCKTFPFNHAKYGKYKRPPYGVSKISANHLSLTLPYNFTSLKMSNALKKRKIAVLGSRSVGEYWELHVIAVLHCILLKMLHFQVFSPHYVYLLMLLSSRILFNRY